jgi:hypothetical protein
MNLIVLRLAYIARLAAVGAPTILKRRPRGPAVFDQHVVAIALSWTTVLRVAADRVIVQTHLVVDLAHGPPVSLQCPHALDLRGAEIAARSHAAEYVVAVPASASLIARSVRHACIADDPGTTGIRSGAVLDSAPRRQIVRTCQAVPRAWANRRDWF